MKVIHVIKKIEEIDQDVRELKKLEKSVKKNKSFTTPIYMSIEKQINLLLGDRIKMLELKIENPPESMRTEIDTTEKLQKPIMPDKPEKEMETRKKESRQKKAVEIEEETTDDEIPMLTQDQIDLKINSLQSEKNKPKKSEPPKSSLLSDNSVKILDIALEKGTLADQDDKKDKKVKFFRDNFPVE